MQYVLFLILALIGISLQILANMGFFNVNPFLVIKQTQNIISKQEPVAVSIPSIKVNTSIHRVGIDKNGKMDAPQNESVIAWYQFSATPGENGAVVLSGHKDSKIGPGVFFTLRDIPDNAEITIKRADNLEKKYTVSQVRKFGRQDFPVKEIFEGNSREKLLYLITCEGTFNIFRQVYDERIVVTAKAS